MNNHYHPTFLGPFIFTAHGGLVAIAHISAIVIVDLSDGFIVVAHTDAHCRFDLTDKLPLETDAVSAVEQIASAIDQSGLLRR